VSYSQPPTFYAQSEPPPPHKKDFEITPIVALSIDCTLLMELSQSIMERKNGGMNPHQKYFLKEALREHVQGTLRRFTETNRCAVVLQGDSLEVSNTSRTYESLRVTVHNVLVIIYNNVAKDQFVYYKHGQQ
jgi:hypothetical protein